VAEGMTAEGEDEGNGTSRDQGWGRRVQ
jgi:hypothetical protein